MDIHQRLLQFVDGHMSIVLAHFADDKFGNIRREVFAHLAKRMGRGDQDDFFALAVLHILRQVIDDGAQKLVFRDLMDVG